jgi:hypothetical protein
MDEILRSEVLGMAAYDSKVRAELAEDGSLFEGYHPRMRAVHEENAARLEEIIEEHGWPGPSLVGEDGAEAAWRIVQHAIGKPPFQRRCLQLLVKAAECGQVSAWQPAYLADRIRVFEGKPQVYGTQFEDLEHVDERRHGIGLDSMAARTQKMREGAKQEGSKPVANQEEWNRKCEAWLREVGWRD